MLYEKILPQNNVELMFNLRRPFGVPNRPPAGRSFQRAWIAGMQQEWLLVTPQYAPSEPSYLLSVRMPPLGAYRVLDLPLGEVAHDVVELDDVLGAEVNRVHERLGNTTDAGQQFAVLCDFVRSRLARSGARLHADAHIAVGMLAAVARCRANRGLVPLARRQPEASRQPVPRARRSHAENLRADVPLSPRRRPRAKGKAARLDAHRDGCGYYDQAHFNHEFREFSGMSPGEYAAANCTDGLTVVVG